MKNREKTAEERKEEFHDKFDAEDDASDTLVELVLAIGKYLGQIVGEEQINPAMLIMLEPLLGGQHENWEEGLEYRLSECFSTWKFGSQLHDLQAYGKFGILIDALEGESTEDKENHLREFIAQTEEFVRKSPLYFLESNHSTPLENVVMLARNRWALDHNDPVEPQAIAIFGGLSEGRIKNMMSGKDRQFQNIGGKVPAKEVLNWLSKRDSFYDSIWKEQNPFYQKSSDYDKLIKPIFVPVARDGSVFHPGLLQNSKYKIGKKNDEIDIADYEDALTALQQMPVPYWRRPNPNNEKSGWGIVRGVEWERMAWDGDLHEEI
jgi:hypothetical protein